MVRQNNKEWDEEMRRKNFNKVYSSVTIILNPFYAWLNVFLGIS